MDLSYALKQLRSELHMTQTELGNALDLNLSTISRWERGVIWPTRSTGRKLLEVARVKGASTICQQTLKDVLFPSAERSGLEDLKYVEMDQINQMLNDSSNMVFVCDCETYEVLYANKQVEKLSGAPLSHAEGKKCYEYGMHRDAPCPFCNMAEISEEEFSEIEFAVARTGKHYLGRGKKMIWDDREVRIEYLTDITERYAIEQQLERREKMLSEACNFADMWVFSYDIKHNSISLNSHMQKVFGLPSKIENFPEQIFEMNAVLPEYIPAYRKMVQDIKDGKEQSETLIQNRYPNGEAHWIKYRMNIIQSDEFGQPLFAICSAQSADEAKAFEIRLQMEHERVLEDRQNLIGYVISNLSQNEILENKELHKEDNLLKSGSAYEQAILKAASDIDSAGEREEFLALHDRKKLLQSYKEGIYTKTMEFQYKRAPGEVVWVRNVMRMFLVPGTTDIYLYEYCFDNHENKLFNGLLSAAVHYNFNLLGAISIPHNQLTQVEYVGEELKSRITIVPFEETSKRYIHQRVLKEDQERVLCKTQIAYIEKELEKKPSFELVFKTHSKEGEVRVYQIRFSWYDKEKEICFVSGMDITQMIKW